MADRGRFALVDTTPGAETVRWGRVASPLELPAALADVEAVTVESSEPVYLVCAHGRHDACCAMRGRPVAAELAATYPDRTWETTHTGGDRFAANVVLLPHGLVLGRVPATEAVAVVERYDAGEIDTVWVRGRSGFSPPAQAAQHHARLAFGESRVDALRVLGRRDPGAGRRRGDARRRARTRSGDGGRARALGRLAHAAHVLGRAGLVDACLRSRRDDPRLRIVRVLRGEGAGGRGRRMNLAGTGVGTGSGGGSGGTWRLNVTNPGTEQDP